MKKLLCAVALLCAYAGAQTINPNQIRPATQNNEILMTVTANQPPAWQPFDGLCGVHCLLTDPVGTQNTTALTLQNKSLCLQDGTNCPPLAFQNYLPDPLGTQSVLIPFTSVVKDSDGDPVHCAITANDTSGEMTVTVSGNLSCNAPQGPSITWSAAALPDYVPPANVSAIYAVADAGFDGFSNGVNIKCTVASTTTILMNGGVGGSDTGVLKPYGAALASATGANVGTVSCAASMAANAGGNSIPFVFNIPSIYLRVYYTGTAPPASDLLNVTAPLYFNPALNSMGVAAIDLSKNGDGGVMGLLPQSNLAAPTQTTLTGTTAGTAVWSQPQQFSTWKQAAVWLNGYENTTATAQTITLPAGFATVSAVLTDSGTCTGVTVSGATVTLPASMGATQTGLCEIRGW